MLTYTEIPGIYIDPKNRVCIAFDQVEAWIVKSSGKSLEIEIFNPTKYTANVKLFIDEPIKEALSQTYLFNAKVVVLQAGETQKVKIN